jgi:hypothetical protein
LLGCEGKAVQAGLNSNPVEFDGIKLRVVEPFPDLEELDGVAIDSDLFRAILHHGDGMPNRQRFNAKGGSSGEA